MKLPFQIDPLSLMLSDLSENLLLLRIDTLTDLVNLSFKDFGKVKKVTRPAQMRCVFVEFYTAEDVEKVLNFLKEEALKRLKPAGLPKQLTINLGGEVVKVCNAFHSPARSLTIRPVAQGPPPAPQVCCKCSCHTVSGTSLKFAKSLNPLAVVFQPKSPLKLTPVNQK